MTTNRLHADAQLGEATFRFLSNIVKNSEFAGKVFVAGGFVRDEILGRPSKDIDLVIMAPDGGINFANWITRKLHIHSPANPVIFPRFGTAKFTLRGQQFDGVDLSGMDIECVMTRKERYTDGSRKPEVEFGTLLEDAERRDFTFNALLKDLVTGEVLDPTGQGLSDLQSQIVRSAIDPVVIFREDPLRMLRAIRFATKFGWDFDQELLTALFDNAPLILTISNERIRDEFNKMLMGPNAGAAVRLLSVTGLSDHCLPELSDMDGVTQNFHHEDDVLSHSVKVMELTPPDLLTRLAALFHDMGKPSTRTDIDGKVQFLRHEDVGAAMVHAMMTRLQYSNAEIHAVSLVVANHMRLKGAGRHGKDVSDKALRKFSVELGEHVNMCLDVMDADNKCHAPTSNLPMQIAGVRERLATLKAPITKPKLPINGHDLMEVFSLTPGPQIKQMLALVEDAWFENPELTPQEAMSIARAAL